MNSLLVDFEIYANIESPAAAKVLGVAYPTYAQYKSGFRKLQRYHRFHIETLRALPQRKLIALIKERTDAS